MEKSKVFVGQEFRTNELSLSDGGSIVEVHYANRVKVYNNVKNTTAYINAIKTKNESNIEKVIATYIDGKKTRHVWLT